METNKSQKGNLKPFKTGKDSRRNHKGRPKKLPEIDTILIEVLGKKTNGLTMAEQILYKMAEKALSGNLMAADMLLTRAYGKGKFEVADGADLFFKAMQGASLRREIGNKKSSETQSENLITLTQQLTVSSSEDIQVKAITTPPVEASVKPENTSIDEIEVLQEKAEKLEEKIRNRPSRNAGNDREALSSIFY